MLNVSPAAQTPNTSRLNSNDTLNLTQADEISSASMSGVVTTADGSHSGTILEVTDAAQQEDDDEDMPTIDMGSDSD
jgi:hypothetical protein